MKRKNNILICCICLAILAIFAFGVTDKTTDSIVYAGATLTVTATNGGSLSNTIYENVNSIDIIDYGPSQFKIENNIIYTIARDESGIVTATANSGYYFAYYSGDINGEIILENETVYSISSYPIVYAIFKKNNLSVYACSANIDSNGNIVKSNVNGNIEINADNNLSTIENVITKIDLTYSNINLTAKTTSSGCFIGWYYSNNDVDNNNMALYNLLTKDTTYTINLSELTQKGNPIYIFAAFAYAPTTSATYTQYEFKYYTNYPTINDCDHLSTIYFKISKWVVPSVGAPYEQISYQYEIPNLTLTCTGYNFLGWSTSLDPSQLITPGINNMLYNYGYYQNNAQPVDETWCVYAIWEAKTYTIKYNANSGIGNMDSQIAVYDKETTLKECTFTKQGHKFIGWSKTADGMVEYKDSQKVVNINQDESVVELFAIWEINKYSITFILDKNDLATIENGMQITVDYGTKIKLNNAELFVGEQQIKITFTTKKGYIISFDKWTGVENNQTIESDITIYGYILCEPINYFICFDANSGTGNMDKMECIYDEPTNLSKNLFKKVGHKFVGWSTNNLGDAEFFDCDEILNLSENNGEEINLFAIWETNSYTIKYNANGGTGSMPTQSVYYGVSANLYKNTFTNNNLMFVGWALSADGNKSFDDCEIIWNLSLEDDQIINLYALWERVQFEINFEVDSELGNFNLTTINVDYGTTASIDRNSIYLGDVLVILEVNTKTGYNLTFNGFENIYDNEKITENKTIYANISIQPISYIIVYNANGGSGQMDNQICIYDQETTLLDNLFLRLGYQFDGWSTSENSNVVYNNKSVVKNLSNNDGESVNLYAHWSVKYYDVIFDGNGSTSGTMDNQRCYFNQQYVLNKVGFYKNGNKFIGWSKDKLTLSLQDCAEFENMADYDEQSVTLYALWEKIDYKFIISSNLGTISQNSNSYTISEQNQFINFEIDLDEFYKISTIQIYGYIGNCYMQSPTQFCIEQNTYGDIYISITYNKIEVEMNNQNYSFAEAFDIISQTNHSEYTIKIINPVLNLDNEFVISNNNKVIITSSINVDIKVKDKFITIQSGSELLIDCDMTINSEKDIFYCDGDLTLNNITLYAKNNCLTQQNYSKTIISSCNFNNAQKSIISNGHSSTEISSCIFSNNFVAIVNNSLGNNLVFESNFDANNISINNHGNITLSNLKFKNNAKDIKTDSNLILNNLKSNSVIELDNNAVLFIKEIENPDFAINILTKLINGKKLVEYAENLTTYYNINLNTNDNNFLSINNNIISIDLPYSKENNYIWITIVIIISCLSVSITTLLIILKRKKAKV